MIRRFHRILGLIMLLPICGWAATGLVFFLKPGYTAAYSALRVREYPIEELAIPSTHPDWLEVRALRTVIGNHLIVRTHEGWTQLDAAGIRPRALSDEGTLTKLVEDALESDRARYGSVSTIIRHEEDGPSASVKTSSGVEIELDWATLAMSQSGNDTRRIDALYRIHYLQWTGLRLLDRVLGVIGLSLLVALAVLGARLAFGGSKKIGGAPPSVGPESR